MVTASGIKFGHGLNHLEHICLHVSSLLAVDVSLRDFSPVLPIQVLSNQDQQGCIAEEHSITFCVEAQTNKKDTPPKD